MQNHDYRLILLVEFSLNVILAQKITNQPTIQINKHTLNQILPELSKKLFFFSFHTAFEDADLIDYKMVLSHPPSTLI